MKQSEVFALLKKFVGQSNVLTAPVAFVRYTGSLDCAVFLSQIIYWTDRSEDGWFYKSYSEWESEICLSEYEVRKNSRLLKNRGILVTQLRKVNGAPVVHYHLEESTFSESILKFLQNPILKDSESNLELLENGTRTNSRNLDTEKTSESINKDYQRLHSKTTYKQVYPPVSDYISSVLTQDGLSATQVAERAKSKGQNLSASYVSGLASGTFKNPTMRLIQALATGLLRPFEEVAEVFRQSLEREISEPPFDGEAFLAALDAYDRTAKQRKVKESPEQRYLLFKKLSQWGEIKATEALENAVTNSWRGVFEPKEVSHHGPRPSDAAERNAERLDGSLALIRELRSKAG